MATVPLIQYADASPEARAVYDNIMQTRKVDDVNNFWKALAHSPLLLKHVWERAQEVMKPGALFAFTVETHSGSGALLQGTLRYAHGEDHFRAAIDGAGLKLRHLAPVSTRTEKGVPVPGLLAIAAR